MNTEATTPNRKRKLYAVLPDGTVATRTTARTYSHVVAVMSSPEQQLAHVEQTILRLEAYIARTDYNDFVQNEDGMWVDAKTGYGRLTEEHPHVGWQNSIDAERAKIEAGFVERWYDHSWAGRPDLAAKAANDKAISKYRTMLVEVTDAEPVEASEVEAPEVEAPAAVETAEAAEAELARRKNNKLVKKTGEGVRIEAASDWAFKASTEELRNLAAA